MPGNYEFGMEAVLNYRKIQKDLESNILAEAERERERLLQGLLECRDRIARLEKELIKSNDLTPMDVQAVIIIKSFIRCLRLEEKEILTCTHRKEEEIEHHRSLLLEKAREQKVLEKLKEKDYAVFLNEERRREGKEIDDLVLMRGGTLNPAV